MSIIYNPKAASRANDFQIEYMINTTGDRWFIPYNDNASMSAQATLCNTVVGNTTDGSACGSGVVPS